MTVCYRFQEISIIGYILIACSILQVMNPMRPHLGSGFIKNKLLATACLLLLHSMLLGLPSDPLLFRITHLTTRNGLPSNQAISIAEDMYGRVWITTQNGICHYDGRKLTPVDPSANLPIGSKWIAFDKKSRLWGSIPSGVFRYDGKNVRRFVLPDSARVNNLVHGMPRIFRDTSVYITVGGWIIIGDSLCQMASIDPLAPQLDGYHYLINPQTGHHILIDAKLTTINIYDQQWKLIRHIDNPGKEKSLSWHQVYVGLYREIEGRHYPGSGLTAKEFPYIVIDPVTEQLTVLADMDENEEPYPLSESAPKFLVVAAKGGRQYIFYILKEGRYVPVWNKVPGSLRTVTVTSSGDFYFCSDKGVHIVHLPDELIPSTLSKNTPNQPVVLLTEAEGAPIAFQDQQQCEVNLTTQQLRIKVQAIGLDATIPSAEYQLNRGKWKAFLPDDELVIQGLQQGRNEIRFRPVPGNSRSLTSGTETMAFVKVDMPFFSRSWVLLGVSLLFISLLGAMVWSGVTRERTRRGLQDLRQQLQYSRLQIIQSQLNPHFLFNAMISLQNTIRNKSAREASVQLIKLAKMIRELLEMSQVPQPGLKLENSLVPLEREVKLVRDYVELENEQRDPPFEFHLEIDPELRRMNPRVPPLMIQPFVENAIIHGISSIDNGKVSVIMKKENKAIRYEIQDNGIGRKAAEERSTRGITRFKSRGGEILRRRIALFRALGFQTELEINDIPEGGTLINITLPITS